MKFTPVSSFYPDDFNDNMNNTYARSKDNLDSIGDMPMLAVRQKNTRKTMTPKETLQKWIDAFNKADIETISDLYADNAINHQVANEPVVGKAAIKQMFADEFTTAEMTCIPENIFEDGEWAILEWKDPNGLRGSGFFQIQNGKIFFQRGYWDKLSFLKLHNLPIS